MSDDKLTDREKAVTDYWIEHIMKTKNLEKEALYMICPLCYNTGIIHDNIFFCICPNGMTRRKNFDEKVGTINTGGGT